MCNGDYPADNGERKTMECPQCGNHWAPEAFKRHLCPDCRNDQAITAYVGDVLPGWGLELQGDPRGCVIKLKTPEGREIGVPS